MAAPHGNKNAANALVAKKALERALAVDGGYAQTPEPESRMSALVEIWAKQIEKAKGGDNDSAKFIVERLAGKAVQPVDLNATISTHEQMLDELGD